MRLALLGLLAQGPKNGYQLITALEEESDGQWRAGPGAVYPILALLHDEDLIEPTEDDARVYQLTDEGRAEAEKAGDQTRPWERLADSEGPGGRGGGRRGGRGRPGGWGKGGWGPGGGRGCRGQSVPFDAWSAGDSSEEDSLIADMRAAVHELFVAAKTAASDPTLAQAVGNQLEEARRLIFGLVSQSDKQSDKPADPA